MVALIIGVSHLLVPVICCLAMLCCIFQMANCGSDDDLS